MAKEELHAFAAYLLEDDFFSGFKYRKSDSSLMKKHKEDWISVSLDNWFKHERRLVQPAYDVRFNVLHKWYEKFSFKTLSDQRSIPTIGFIHSMITEQLNSSFFAPREYHIFSEDNVYYMSDTNEYPNQYRELRPIEEDWEIAKNEIIQAAKIVFGKFQTLEDFYRFKVYPAIMGEKELPDVGADWIFIYLASVKIVDQENYDLAKQVILDRIDFLLNDPNRRRPEPNIKMYDGRFNEIFNYLEHFDFSN